MSGRLVPPPNISQRKRLSDEVAAYIRELIMAGVLRPGQIVNIDSFAREIGVSATPVREALMVLVSEGFLLTERHRGFVVAPLDRQDIKDVFEVHASIGGELAARAARRATPDFLAKLEKNFDAPRTRIRPAKGDVFGGRKLLGGGDESTQHRCGQQ